MLTSFFVRFAAIITKSEFEELKKIAIRVERVETADYEENKHRITYVLIGKHWVVLARETTSLITNVERILFPCEPSDAQCVEPIDELSKSDLLDNSSYILMSGCVDIDIQEIRYSTMSNEAWITFKCVKKSYEALFNIVIDPKYVYELDQFILHLIAKYFRDFVDLPSMFRPM